MTFDPETLSLWFPILFLVGATAFSLQMLFSYIQIRRRLSQEFHQSTSLIGRPGVMDLTFDQEQRSQALKNRTGELFKYLSQAPKNGAKIRQKLVQAGIFDVHGVGKFMAARVAVALVLPMLIAITIEVLNPDAAIAAKVMFPIATALIGLFLPDFYLSKRTTALQAECSRGFPDFLDLLVVATDAGLSLEAAMSRVGNEIIRTYPKLGANVQLMNLEMRAGRDFAQAMDGLVQRLNVDEVRSFATLLHQSRELGSSVTQALRVYSDDMRHKRMSKAEEKAHALPVKLVIPLGLFLFPVMMMVALLPVAMRVKAAFFVGN